MKSYGKELILDLHDCDSLLFNRGEITRYFYALCDLIEMERCDLHFWDDVGVSAEDRQTEPHLKGTSAVQFIMTSSVVIHALDLLKKVYINVFSCKDFDAGEVAMFSAKWFRGQVVNSLSVERH